MITFLNGRKRILYYLFLHFISPTVCSFVAAPTVPSAGDTTSSSLSSTADVTASTTTTFSSTSPSSSSSDEENVAGVHANASKQSPVPPLPQHHIVHPESVHGCGDTCGDGGGLRRARTTFAAGQLRLLEATFLEVFCSDLKDKKKSKLYFIFNLNK